MSRGDSNKPVCLLTGASGTLGEALWQRARRRYRFAAVYHDAVPAMPSQETEFFDPLDPTARVGENADPVFAIQADLATAQGCEWAARAALDEFGCIDLVVHAAAYSVWGDVLTSEELLESAERQFAVNVLAPLRLGAHVARLDWSGHTASDNRAADRNMVLLSSTAGVRIYHGNGQAVYGASKAALNHLACQLADEFAGIGVRVTALAPDSFPAAVPTEAVVDAVLALASTDVTGKVLILDEAGQRWMNPVQHAARRLVDA